MHKCDDTIPRGGAFQVFSRKSMVRNWIRIRLLLITLLLLFVISMTFMEQKGSSVYADDEEKVYDFLSCGGKMPSIIMCMEKIIFHFIRSYYRRFCWGMEERGICQTKLYPVNI